MLKDSKILSTSEQAEARDLFSDPHKFTLLYCAERDGWDRKAFGPLVYGKGKTITIIKTTGGRIIGGYADMPLEGKGGLKTLNHESFVFYFKNGISRLMPSKGKKAELEFDPFYMAGWYDGFFWTENCHKYYTSWIDLYPKGGYRLPGD